MQKALESFKTQVVAITGKQANERQVKRFIEEYETTIAHRTYLVQVGFCDFQTLSGKAETVSVNLCVCN